MIHDGLVELEDGDVRRTGGHAEGEAIGTVLLSYLGIVPRMEEVLVEDDRISRDGYRLRVFEELEESAAKGSDLGVVIGHGGCVRVGNVGIGNRSMCSHNRNLRNTYGHSTDIVLLHRYNAYFYLVTIW